MKTYHVYFTGKLAGALGITYPIYTIVEAENRGEIWEKLYSTFDSVCAPVKMDMRITPCPTKRHEFIPMRGSE